MSTVAEHPTDKTAPAWKRLAWLMQRTAYGDELAHESIAGVLGVAYGTNHYYALVKTAIDDEQKRKRHWRLVPQHGYRLLFPHEIHALAADHVGKAKASITRGAVALQRRDTLNVPRLIDKGYASGEAALMAMTELLGYIEREMRIAGAPARFDALKAVAQRACEEWRQDMSVATGQINIGHATPKHDERWRPFRCMCGVTLVRFVGVSRKNRKALLMTCGRCGNKNALFGVSEATALEVVVGQIVAMVDG